ncbi:ORF2 [Fort Crockett virus]|nr:ORF2 [Fort Crockett virus]
MILLLLCLIPAALAICSVPIEYIHNTYPDSVPYFHSQTEYRDVIIHQFRTKCVFLYDDKTVFHRKCPVHYSCGDMEEITISDGFFSSSKVCYPKPTSYKYAHNPKSLIVDDGKKYPTIFSYPHGNRIALMYNYVDGKSVYYVTSRACVPDTDHSVVIDGNYLNVTFFDPDRCAIYPIPHYVNPSFYITYPVKSDPWYSYCEGHFTRYVTGGVKIKIDVFGYVSTDYDSSEAVSVPVEKFTKNVKYHLSTFSYTYGNIFTDIMEKFLLQFEEIITYIFQILFKLLLDLLSPLQKYVHFELILIFSVHYVFTNNLRLSIFLYLFFIFIYTLKLIN